MPQNTLAPIVADLKTGGGVALAFSGGLDSSVLLELFLRQGADVLALHFTGPHLEAAHSRAALEYLQERHVPSLAVNFNSLELEELRLGSPRRCYFCKRRAFGLLAEQAGGRVLCDGTNADDLGAYRPGLAALRELSVRSPLAEAGLDKARIRALAADLGLNISSGGQNCLLTRFAYGLEINESDLRALESAEAEIRCVLENHRGAMPPTEPRCVLRPLNFRLRRLRADRFELHVEAGAPLPGALAGRLADLLARRGLPGTPVITMHKISGFFDKK